MIQPHIPFSKIEVPFQHVWRPSCVTPRFRLRIHPFALIYTKRAPPSKWTQEELEKVAEMRSQGRSREEIVSALPGKSLKALDYQLFRCKGKNKHFPRPSGNMTSPWSESELRLVQHMLDEGMSVPQIVTAVPNRLPYMIYAAVKTGKLYKARKEFKSKLWSVEENAILTQMLLDRQSDKEILAALPNKTLIQLNHRLYKSRLKVGRPKLWSDEELAVLKQMLRGAKTIQEVAAALPNKTITQVKTRMRHGGEKLLRKQYPRIQHFSEEEDLRLRELKQIGAPWSEILAAIPSRNYRSLAGRWNYLVDKESQSKPERHMEEWSGPEDDLLLYLWANQQLSRAIIAGVLQRSKSTISTRIGTLKTPGLTLKRWKGFVANRITKEQADRISVFIRTELARKRAARIDDLLATFDESFTTTLPPRHSQFYTPEEDDEIIRMRQEGWSWSAIAKEALPGRTVQGLKLRWMRLKKARSPDIADEDKSAN